LGQSKDKILGVELSAHVFNNQNNCRLTQIMKNDEKKKKKRGTWGKM
jgi:hypothetical protein